jgi:hypothetical protein
MQGNGDEVAMLEGADKPGQIDQVADRSWSDRVSSRFKHHRRRAARTSVYPLAFEHDILGGLAPCQQDPTWDTFQGGLDHSWSNSYTLVDELRAAPLKQRTRILVSDMDAGALEHDKRSRVYAVELFLS